MMPFAEKLSFLMHITKTRNKELAEELSVDPSMISLMRTGKRKPSKNPVQIQRMAFFFAKRCPAAFQRQALSEMLDQAAISPSMPVEALAANLEKWLHGEKDIAETLLSGIQSPPVKMAQPAAAPSPAPEDTVSGQTLFFYGEEGRREVMTLVMQEIHAMETPTSVLTVVDDNLEWLLSDYLLSKRIQSQMLDAIERGFTFYQIMPPMNFINRYTESLQFWLPIYAAGKTKVYYYPRLRGNLYRHSIIVVPKRCVQYASSVGLGSTSDITMFSTDPRLVDAFEQQFQEHIALCRPALNVHRDAQEVISCFLEFFTRQGDTIQAVNFLSTNSIPRALLAQFAQESSNPSWQQVFQKYLNEQPCFENRLRHEPYIDMCRLATAEEVRSGKVPVGAPIQWENGQPCYTPETYCLHLKNILRLMDTYPNYTFLPLREKEPGYELFVNESGMALLVRTSAPLFVLEMRRPHMVLALQEHLMRKADAIGYEGASRERIRMELRALIQKLGG